MTDKQKNFVVRSITGILFVAIMVAGFLNPRAMVFLFALITGMAMWEYTGLVNDIEDVKVNRMISTVAGVYLFLAVAAWRMGIVANFIIFVPYLLTVVYLFISELYTGNKNAVADCAYTKSPRVPNTTTTRPKPIHPGMLSRWLLSPLLAHQPIKAATTITNSPPPIEPSQLFPGLTRGKSLCLPNNEPQQ